MIPATFQMRLAHASAQSHLSAPQIDKIIDWPIGTLARLIGGEFDPYRIPLAIQVQLADILNVSRDWLFDGTRSVLADKAIDRIAPILRRTPMPPAAVDDVLERLEVL